VVEVAAGLLEARVLGIGALPLSGEGLEVFEGRGHAGSVRDLEGVATVLLDFVRRLL